MTLRKIIRWPARTLIRFLSARSPRFSAWFGKLMASRAFDKKLIALGFRKIEHGKWVKHG